MDRQSKIAGKNDPPDSLPDLLADSLPERPSDVYQRGARPGVARPKLGILGGMGPLATADFLTKVVRATPAVDDADHIPTVVWCVPQIPDRMAAIDGAGESPLTMMVEGLQALARCGAVQAVIACNTAHHWYDALVEQGGLPILHIADAAADALSAAGACTGHGSGASHRQSAGCAGSGAGTDASVMLLATRGTHAAGFYPPRLAARGYRALPFDEALQVQCIDPAIAAVKADELASAGELLAEALRRVAATGIDKVLLACTELPLAYAALVGSAGSHAHDSHYSGDSGNRKDIGDQGPDALRGVSVIDASQALAEQCVRRWFDQYPNSAIHFPSTTGVRQP